MHTFPVSVCFVVVSIFRIFSHKIFAQGRLFFAILD